MAAYAKVSDLIARWRDLKEAEVARAEILLADAATTIRKEGFSEENPDEDTLEMLKIISCEMVKRAMLASVDQPAATQSSMTVGPFSGSLTYTNPTGDLYLTKAEKRRLGISGPRIGFVSLRGEL